MKVRFPRTKSLIIQVRGSNGSGKSTAVRRFLGMGFVPLYNGFPNKPEKVWGYRIVKPRWKGKKLEFLRPPIYIVGPYETPTGGCDCLPNMDFILDQVKILARYGHVIFEGAMISTVIGRFIELEESVKDYAHCIFGVMDTSQKRCVKRVNKRRALKGKEPIDPKRSMDGKYRSVQTSAKGLEKRGMDVRVIPYKRPFKTLVKWLGEEKYGRRND
jgi:hypothetical protein